MARRLVSIDRDTPLLLPPDLRDWVPADDPARLVVALVENLDLGAAVTNERGTGSEEYPPGMMLALLVYSYSHGVFSSRAIERGTHTHVGMRYITADMHPDHDTICKFRRKNRELVRSAFAGSLGLAREAGILQVGDVSIDGTKLAGAASTDSAMSGEALDAKVAAYEEEERALQATVDGLLAAAEEADSRAASPPPAPADIDTALRAARKSLRDKEACRARLQAAREEFARLKAAASEEREVYRERVRESGIGQAPKALSAEVEPADRINTTDPGTAKMKGRHGYVDGYNAQAGIDSNGGGSGLLLSAYVTRQTSDRLQVEANARELEANLGRGAVNTMSGDRGYDNTHQIAEVERRRGGPTVLCLQQRGRGEAQAQAGQSESGDGGTKRQTAQRGRRRKTWELRARQRRRLDLPGNRARRKRRGVTIEPAFGVIKEQMGFKRFSLRGLEKADTEWRLVALAYNVRKLSRDPRWAAALGCGGA